MIRQPGTVLRSPANACGRCHGYVAISAAALGLVACSEAHLTRSGAFDDPNPPAVTEGVFEPGNVAGIEFVSGSERGTTGPNGRFTCATGQLVEFSIGNVRLGEAPCATIAHPASFVPSGELTSAVAINMTRFLLLLDDDQVAGNGIDIPSSLLALAESWDPIDFGAADFEDQLVRVIADIASVEMRADVEVPSNVAAFDFLDSNLACVYSGAFANTFISGAFQSLTEGALLIHREPGSNTDRFVAQVQRQHPQAHFFVFSRGTVEMNAWPSLVPGGGPSGNVSGRYSTPDRVGLQWEAAVAQQSIDRTGAFEAARIGASPGEYRFSGTYGAAGFSDTPAPLGFVSLMLDGDQVRGEAFDFPLAGGLTVSGSRLPGTDTIELRTQYLDETVTATLLRDESGELIGLEGGWPGIDKGVLTMTGCRLN
jgi:hypothetical protein